MDLFALNKQEFIDKFLQEIEHVGSNAALIKNNLLKEGKNKQEITEIVSAYFRALGVKMDKDSWHQIEDQLEFDRDSLNIGPPRKEDFQLVNKLNRDYKLFRLDIMMTIIQTPKAELQKLQETIGIDFG